MTPRGRLCCSFSLLLLLVLPAPWARTGEDGLEIDDPRELVERIRRGEPLSREEEEAVETIARRRGWTRNEVADHLSRAWETSERLDRRGPQAPTDVPLWRQPSIMVPLGLAALLLVADVLYLIFKPRLRDRARVAAMRRGQSASEIVQPSASAASEASVPDDAAGGVVSDAEDKPEPDV
jgi:hypothetical protein